MDINMSSSSCSSPTDSADPMLINNPMVLKIISGHCQTALECFQNNASAAKMVDIRMKNSKSISDIIGVSSSPSTDTTTTTQDMFLNTDEVSSNGQNLLVNAEDIAMGLFQIINSHQKEALSMFKTNTPASQMITLRMKNLSALKELGGTSLPLSSLVLQEQLVNAEEEAMKLFEKDLLRGNNSSFVDGVGETIFGDTLASPQREGNNKNNANNEAPGTSEPSAVVATEVGTGTANSIIIKQLNGISYSKTKRKYQAGITIEKKRYLGLYELATDAAHAHDKAARLLGNPSNEINFATSEDFIKLRNSELQERNISLDLEESLVKIDSKVEEVVMKHCPDVNATAVSQALPHANKVVHPHNFNLLRGSNWSESGKYFTSQIGCNNNGYSLGYYQLSSDAARAYDKATMLLRNPPYKLNFATAEDYISMRKLEIRERKRDNVVDLDEMSAIIDSKVNEVVSKVKRTIKEVAKEEDEMAVEEDEIVLSHSSRKRTQPKPFVPNQSQTMGGKKATSSPGFTVKQMEQMYNGKRVVDMTDDELRAKVKDHPEGKRVVDVLGRDKLIAACASRGQRPSFGNSKLCHMTQNVSYTEKIRINLINCLEGKEFVRNTNTKGSNHPITITKSVGPNKNILARPGLVAGKAEDEMVVDESEEDIRRSGRKRVQPKPFVAYRGQDSAYSRAGSSAGKPKKMVSHVLFRGKIESVGKDKSPLNSACKKGALVPNNPAPVPHNPIESLWEQTPSLDRELAWLVEETALIMPPKENDTTPKLELPLALELALVHGSNELHRALSASFPTEVKSMLKSMKNSSPIAATGMKLKQLTEEGERGDRVFGAWWQEGVNRVTTPPSYYPGTIDSYNTVGMDRFYSVLFDDGEESHNLKSSHIMIADEEASKLVLVEGQHLRTEILESSIFESLREDAGKALLLSYRRSDSLGIMMEFLKESRSTNKNSALVCPNNNKDSKQQERVSISVVRPSNEVELGLGVEKRDDRMAVTSIAPGIFDGSQLGVGMIIDSVNGSCPLTYKEALHTLQNAEGMINIVALSSIIGGMPKRQQTVNSSQQHFPTKQNLSSCLGDITNSPPRKKKKKLVSNVVSNDQKKKPMSTVEVALFSTADYDRVFPA